MQSDDLNHLARTIIDNTNAQERGIEDLLKKNEEIISSIKATELEKRQALERINSQRESIIGKAASLLNKLSTKAELVRRQIRMLEEQQLVCTKRMKRYSSRIESCLHATKKIAEQRKIFVQRMRDPGWETPHHFHLTALDHYSGNPQPSLMDIATMIKGHLRICAAARSLISSQRLTHELVDRLRKEIQNEKLCEGKVTSMLSAKKKESSEILHVVGIINQRYGAEIERYRRLRSKADAETADASADPDAMLKRGSANRNRYLSIKMRYFGTLDKGSQPTKPQRNSESVPFIPGVPGIDPNQKSGTMTQSRIRLDIDSDPSKSPGSKALAESSQDVPAVDVSTNANSNNNNNTQTKKREGSVSSILSNLLSGRKKDKDGKEKQSEPSSILEEWTELTLLVDEMDNANRTQQQAWEELESILDRRERLQHTLEELRQGWEKQFENEEKADTKSSKSHEQTDTEPVIVPPSHFTRTTRTISARTEALRPDMIDKYIA